MDTVTLLEKLARNSKYILSAEMLFDKGSAEFKNAFLTGEASVLKKELSSTTYFADAIKSISF